MIATCESQIRWSDFPEYLTKFRSCVDKARRFRTNSECQDDADELAEVCKHKRSSLARLLDEVPLDSKEAYYLNRWRLHFEEVCKLLDSDAPSPLSLAPDALDNVLPRGEMFLSSCHSQPTGQPACDSKPAKGEFDKDLSLASILLQSVDSELLELEARQRRAAELVSISKDVEELKAVQMQIERLISDDGMLSEVGRQMSNAKTFAVKGNQDMCQVAGMRSTRGVRRVLCTLTALTSGITAGCVFGTVGACLTFAILGGGTGVAIGQSIVEVTKRTHSQGLKSSC